MRRQNLEGQGLSTREREVLWFLSDGKNTVEIAKKLRLSLKTVQVYCTRAKEKLGAQNMTQLVRTAFLLHTADMVGRFDKWLNGIGSIEMRYFDLEGKLIAKRRLECTAPARLRKRIKG